MQAPGSLLCVNFSYTVLCGHMEIDSKGSRSVFVSDYSIGGGVRTELEALDRPASVQPDLELLLG